MINDAIINHVIRISRLKLKEEEYNTIKEDLMKIINAFEVLNEVNVKNIEPAFHPIEIYDNMRDDNIKPFENVEQILKPTKTSDRYVRGPRLP